MSRKTGLPLQQKLGRLWQQKTFVMLQLETYLSSVATEVMFSISKQDVTWLLLPQKACRQLLQEACLLLHQKTSSAATEDIPSVTGEGVSFLRRFVG